MMMISFGEVAAANAETYASSDRLLWHEMKRALESIETEDARSKEVALRHGANTAWVITVHVHGRDEAYQVIWVPHPSERTAQIVHLGPSLS